MTNGARPGAADRGAPAVFAGNGFSISMPPGWVDRTIYTLLGPAGKDPATWVRIVVDPEVPDGSVEAFADRGIRAASASSPGSRMLRRRAQALADGTASVRAEIRWFATDEIRFYQRLVFVLWGSFGVTAVAHLTKKTRGTQGPIVDAVMESIRQRRPGVPDPEIREGAQRFVAERFLLDLPAGWKDETVYVLAEPDESRFRRNLVIRREPLEASIEAQEGWLDGEVESLRGGVPGFELLKRHILDAGDGRPAGLVRFRRRTDAGATVLQSQLLAPRDLRLYVLSVTTEDPPAAETTAALEGALASFAADS